MVDPTVVRRDDGRVRYQCYVCGAVRAVDDVEIAGCCYDTLLDISDKVNAAVLGAISRRLPDLIARSNEQGDRIADAAIVSDDPRARKAAIAWRNFRRNSGGTGPKA